jgi:membrane protein
MNHVLNYDPPYLPSDFRAAGYPDCVSSAPGPGIVSSMPENAAGLGGTAKRIADRARTIVRLELELAKLEVQRKVAAIAIGAGLAIAAVVMLLYALGFAFSAAAAGLETTLPTWASLLIVAGALLLIAGVLGAFAAASLRKGTPPVPEQALEEARRTTEALRTNGRG